LDIGGTGTGSDDSVAWEDGDEAAKTVIGNKLTLTNKMTNERNTWCITKNLGRVNGRVKVTGFTALPLKLGC